jgi:hypothetical protein
VNEGSIVKNEPVDRENYTVTRNIICNIRIYEAIRRTKWDAHVEGDEQNIFPKTSKKFSKD